MRTLTPPAIAAFTHCAYRYQLGYLYKITPIAYDSPPTGTGIAIARNDAGRINTHHPMVFGPEICTAWGDPFSPLTPTWGATYKRGGHCHTGPGWLPIPQGGADCNITVFLRNS